MKKLLLSALMAATLLGCKSSMPRQSIRPDEASYHFTVRHSQTRQQAFNNVELALADAYNDLPEVLKLKQPETGTFLLKPLVAYQVVNMFGPIQHARYTLKIVVDSGSITLDYQLGTERSQGTWPPETQIPKIKADFEVITGKIAMAVKGSLE